MCEIIGIPCTLNVVIQFFLRDQQLVKGIEEIIKDLKKTVMGPALKAYKHKICFAWLLFHPNLYISQPMCVNFEKYCCIFLLFFTTNMLSFLKELIWDQEKHLNFVFEWIYDFKAFSEKQKMQFHLGKFTVTEHCRSFT